MSAQDPFGGDDDDTTLESLLEPEQVDSDDDDFADLEPDAMDLTKADVHLPEVVVALPINQRPVFPQMNLPMAIPQGPLADIVRHAIDKHDGFLGFFYDPRSTGRWHELWS